MRMRWIGLAAAGVISGAMLGQARVSLALLGSMTRTVIEAPASEPGPAGTEGAGTGPATSAPAAATGGATTQAPVAAEEAALHPKGLTFDFKEATASAVSKALSDATGTSLWNVSGGPFTLKVTDAPLWDVFLKLNEQGDVTLADAQAQRVAQFGGIRMVGLQAAIKSGVRSGDFLALASQLSYSRSLDLQGDEKPRASLTMTFAVVADPRLNVVAWQRPELTKVVDEEGRELYGGSGGSSGFSPVSNSAAAPVYASVTLKAGLGSQKIALAQGHARALVGFGEVKVEVADLAKQGNQPIVVGEQEIKVLKCEVNNGSVTIELRQEPRPGGTGGVAGDRVSLPITVKIEDSKGIQVYVGTGSFSGQFGGQFVGPIKGTFTAAAKTRAVEVPFELRDLAIPQ